MKIAMPYIGDNKFRTDTRRHQSESRENILIFAY